MIKKQLKKDIDKNIWKDIHYIDNQFRLYIWKIIKKIDDKYKCILYSEYIENRWEKLEILLKEDQLKFSKSK